MHTKFQSGEYIVMHLQVDQLKTIYHSHGEDMNNNIQIK